MNDILRIKQKKAIFRSWNRGRKETDLLLGPFADEYVMQMNGIELDNYLQFLNNHDADLFQWLTHSENYIALNDNSKYFVDKIISFHDINRTHSNAK